MKRIILSIVIFVGIQQHLSAQLPYSNISSRLAKKYQIRQIDILLDSATEGYKRPFPEVKMIKFDYQGRAIEKEHIISDVHHIHNYHFLSYDSNLLVKLVRIEVPINAPSFFESDTVTIEYQYQNGLLKRQMEYSQGRLMREITYAYKDGKESVKRTHDLLFKSLTIDSLKYNTKGLIASEKISGNDGELFETHTYTHKNDLLVKETVELGQKGLGYEYQYEYDNHGNRIKETFIKSDGTVRWKTNYEYDSNDLLIYETTYNDKDEFDFRFKTTYSYREKNKR